MAIYSRCPNCRKDNKSTLKICTKCKSKLATKYIVKVKDSSTGKWSSKTLPTLKLAKEVETKLKSLNIEGKLFDKKRKGAISFESYLDFAKLHKKTWKEDESRWRIHVNRKDFKTKNGILKILQKLRDKGYKPQTIDHVLKLIRLVYNW